MKKYKITIENLENGDYEGINEIECDGFAILAHKEAENSFGETVHNLTRFDLAILIAQSNTLFPATFTAHGIVEAEKAERERNFHSGMGKLSNLIGGLGK